MWTRAVVVVPVLTCVTIYFFLSHFSTTSAMATGKKPQPISKISKSVSKNSINWETTPSDIKKQYVTSPHQKPCPNCRGKRKHAHRNRVLQSKELPVLANSKPWSTDRGRRDIKNISMPASPGNVSIPSYRVSSNEETITTSTISIQRKPSFNNHNVTSEYSLSEPLQDHQESHLPTPLPLKAPETGRPRGYRQATPSSPGPEVVTANSKNIRARLEGDAIIGALFPLHQQPTEISAYTRQCAPEIREQYGIQRVEAFLMAIEKINNDSSILPDIKLGWDIRDSCWYSAIALENSIDFIKDAIASQNGDGGSATGSVKPYGNSSVGISGATPICREAKHLKPIAGLVGPGSSEATIQVQNLLQSFNIPQIGYSATSMDLSDKSRYRYFLRVAPPDIDQAQAMVDLVVHFNWTYISVIHSDGNYGVKGSEKFKDLAKDQGVCIATTDNVDSSAGIKAFDDVLDNLLEHPKATVVVCFCEGLTVKKLFQATRRKNQEGRFLIVGSDGWGNRPDVVEGNEYEAVGGISMKLYSPELPNFHQYYASLRPGKHAEKNPWFDRFWQQRFRCSLDPHRLNGYPRFCVGNESLADSRLDSKLGFVVNAVTTMAIALHSMHSDICQGYKGLCPEMDPINGSVYLKYLLNVSFESYSGEMVHFDSRGDPPGRYEILNFQPRYHSDNNVTYDYVTIGRWMTGTLQMNGNPVYWPRGKNQAGGVTGAITSVCSEPCKWDEAKKVRGVACCWICNECKENEIVVDNKTDCKSCAQGYWPDANKTDCDPIPVDFISWSDTEAIVCISLACLGICATGWICVIFIRHNHTPIVKASTRELSYIILVGICLAFSANFFIVAKPRKSFCYLARILPGLSFSLMYGALVTRTNRIARILEGSKRIMTKKPRFMSATAQVVITGIIIGIECAVITGMLVYQPADSKMDYPAPKKVRLVCDTSTLGIVVPLGFDLVLIMLCTIYAVKTRNLPENFNEAKFIGFTMYSTCIIWLGFFPIYFAGQSKEITLSISISLSAAIALGLLFLPKVYVIVWVPEKNTRGAFTTSRDVRCHIGSKSMASGDSIDIKSIGTRESSTLENLFKSDRGQGKQWRQKSLDEKRLRFVMQRAPAPDTESPYINHGVLTASQANSALGGASSSNLGKLKESKDSSRTTDSTLTSTTGYTDRDSLYPSSRDISAASTSGTSPNHPLSQGEHVRQNLSRELVGGLAPPQHSRRPTFRPGSPAEREKHRIHNVDPSEVSELDQLLGGRSQTVNGTAGATSAVVAHVSTIGLASATSCAAAAPFWRIGDVRKSLSSNCVSCSYPRTRDAGCQTSHDLLSGLRRRKVARSIPKKRLQRSEAMDDHSERSLDSVFYFPSSRYSVSSEQLLDDPLQSPSEVSETSPLIVCHSYDQQGIMCSLSDVSIQGCMSPCGSNHTVIPGSQCSHHHPSSYQPHHHSHCRAVSQPRHLCPRSSHCRRHSYDPEPSLNSGLLTPTRSKSPRRDSHHNVDSESQDLSFMEGVDELEASILGPDLQKSRRPQGGVKSQRLSHNFPEAGISPSGSNHDCIECQASPQSLSNHCTYHWPQVNHSHHQRQQNHHHHHHHQHPHICVLRDGNEDSAIYHTYSTASCGGQITPTSPRPALDLSTSPSFVLDPPPHALQLQDSSSSCSHLSDATSSSSFTLPPFQTSTESNHSDDTDHEPLDFADEKVEGSGACTSSYAKNASTTLGKDDDDEDDDETDNESEMSPLNGTQSSRGAHSSTSNDLHQIQKLIPLHCLSEEAEDVLAFQHYLEGHGVSVDLSNVKTSDL